MEFAGLRVRRERIDVARIAERVHDTFHARGHPLRTRIGIDPGFLSRIFQPFTQESASGARQEGFGLGLYIVPGLIDAMGGTVEATSVVGEGSRFTRLPRAPDR